LSTRTTQPNARSRRPTPRISWMAARKPYLRREIWFDASDGMRAWDIYLIRS